MKSIRMTGSAQQPGLTQAEIPEPKPQKGEVSVRVYAAGVTPTEIGWYPTSHTKSGDVRMGAVPSHEFSGVIAEIGDGVTGLAVGQEVFGMNDWFWDGALAEFCLTRPEWIAPKPRHLSHAAAASVPIGALTAWQGLFVRAKLRAGERVLIHGGSGAVGVFAIQLARLHDAEVITTVSTHHVEFAGELGANQVIDYKTSHFENQVKDIDVVFDAVGGETLRRSWGVLKAGGRMVTIASGEETTKDERVKDAFFIMEPNREQLTNIGRLIDTGKLRTVVDAVLPFSQAAEAYTGTVKRSGRGKLVIAVGQSESLSQASTPR
jgi:NADPH:quinone reductase-like Zn-dependent oxidoreductase